MTEKEDGRLRLAFKNQEIAPDAAAVGRTVRLAELEMRRRRVRKSIPFRIFLIRQVRFIGFRLWTFQGLCLIALYVLLSLFFQEPFAQTGRQITFLLCCCSIGAFMTAVPFLYRSYYYRMLETEAACRFSVSSLMCARLLAVAAGDAVMLLVIFFLAHIYTSLESGSILLCLTVPYLAVGGICLYLLGHSSPGTYAYGSAAAGAALSAALFFITRLYPRVFSQGFTPLWICLCIGLALFFAAQLRYIGKHGFCAEIQLS